MSLVSVHLATGVAWLDRGLSEAADSRSCCERIMPVYGDELVGLVAPKCSKLIQPLRGKAVDLHATGDRQTNALIKVLKCQTKETKKCGSELERYLRCHNSIMGSGVYEGKKNCGPELMALFMCAFDH